MLARHIPRYPGARYIGTFPLHFTLTETGISFIIGGGGGGGGYLDRGSTLLTVTGVWLTVCKEDTLETM